MLLYDFASKDELIMEWLSEVRRRESGLLAGDADVSGASGADLVQIIWNRASSAERAPLARGAGSCPRAPC
ncbi:MAG: hypothetical protein ACRDOK_16430 [Streptosporangiaceae bacterium]